MNYKKILLAAFLLLTAAACTSSPMPTAEPSALPPSSTPLPPAATSTPGPLPSATPLPSVTPTPTPSLAPTPTLNPLAIAAMRLRSYPGSEIKFEQTLKPGFNYNQYIVSYLSDGLKIYALMSIPFGQRPPTGWPVIIFNHGYIPPATYHTTEHYVAHFDILSRAGYIVFKSDYRGHGSSQGQARGGYGTPDYTVDVLNALTSLQQYKDADPDRIGMWGHSMGGQVTLRAMVVSKAIKVGVIWAGVVASMPDLLSKWHTPIPTEVPESVRHWHEQLSQLEGTPEQNPAFWASISPITFVADISGPLQLHHGTADTQVPYAFSVSLDEAMLKAGKTVQFFTYPGADHNLLNKDFTDAIYRTIEFFNKYLK